jgi:hypothetical protein
LLAEKCHELVAARGYKFVFAFPNDKSLPTALRRLKLDEELPFQGGLHFDVIPGRAVDAQYYEDNLNRTDTNIRDGPPGPLSRPQIFQLKIKHIKIGQ